MLGLLLKGWRSLFIKEYTVPVAARTKCVCKTLALTWVQRQGAGLAQIYPMFMQEWVLRNGNNTCIDSFHFRFEESGNKNEWTFPADIKDKSGSEFLVKMYNYTSLQKARCSAIP